MSHLAIKIQMNESVLTRIMAVSSIFEKDKLKLNDFMLLTISFFWQDNFGNVDYTTGKIRHFYSLFSIQTWISDIPKNNQVGVWISRWI